MKNQYFGDVGDYGKYGLLRFLVGQGVSVAVNWYLTQTDDSNDGKQISYLEDLRFWKYDPELYQVLKESVIDKKERKVSVIEESGLIPDAKFFHDEIEDPYDYSKDERDSIRSRWHMKGLEFLAGAQLVFLDPDTGFRENMPKKINDAVKYCYAGEVSDYYKSGADVFYYCHKGRRTDDQWEDAKMLMKKATPEAVMMGLTFHKGTQRSYIFAVHPKRADVMRRNLDAFLHTNWKDMFTPEYVGGYEWTK